MTRRTFAGCLALVATFAPLAGHSAAAEPAAGPNAETIAAAKKALKVAPGETVVFFEDLHCATCAKKVTGQLFKQKGVLRVRTSVKLDAAVVTPQAKKAINPAAAWIALQSAGYQPALLDGPDGTFAPHGDEKQPQKVAEAAPAQRR
jgi:copper chaperone CopZ